MLLNFHEQYNVTACSWLVEGCRSWSLQRGGAQVQLQHAQADLVGAHDVQGLVLTGPPT